MSHYDDTLVIDSCSTDGDLALAAELLASGKGTVIIDALIALRAMGTYILCDVIDATPATHRCEHEYEVLMENAQRMLAASRLRHQLPDLPCRWRIVARNSNGIEELWRAR